MSRERGAHRSQGPGRGWRMEGGSQGAVGPVNQRGELPARPRGPAAAAEMFAGGGRGFRGSPGCCFRSVFSRAGRSQPAGREEGNEGERLQTLLLQRESCCCWKKARSHGRKHSLKASWRELEYGEKSPCPASRGRSAPAHLRNFQRR